MINIAVENRIYCLSKYWRLTSMSRRAGNAPSLREGEQHERSEHGACDRHSHSAVVNVVNFVSTRDLWVPLPYRDDEYIGEKNVRIVKAKDSAQHQNEERQATDDSCPLSAEERL